MDALVGSPITGVQAAPVLGEQLLQEAADGSFPFLADDAVGILVLGLILLVVAAALGGTFALDEVGHLSEEGIGPEWRENYLLMSLFLSLSRLTSRKATYLVCSSSPHRRFLAGFDSESSPSGVKGTAGPGCSLSAKR